MPYPNLNFCFLSLWFRVGPIWDFGMIFPHISYLILIFFSHWLWILIRFCISQWIFRMWIPWAGGHLTQRKKLRRGLIWGEVFIQSAAKPVRSPLKISMHTQVRLEHPCSSQTASNHPLRRHNSSNHHPPENRNIPRHSWLCEKEAGQPARKDKRHEGVCCMILKIKRETWGFQTSQK